MTGPRSRDHARGPLPPRRSTPPKRDPGAYIGRLPERAPDRADERVPAAPGPDGHREPTNAQDDIRRGAGLDR